MARRRPVAQPLRDQHALDASWPKQEPPPQNPDSQGDVIQPFLQAGGQPFILEGWPQGNATAAGVQLLAYQAIPRGRVGFIKRIAAAPYCPPALFDPWAGWPANFESFEQMGPPLNLPAQRGSARAGLWRTPFGWESYISTGTEIRPSWRWVLTAIPGNLDNIRAAQLIPAFDQTDPNSWLYCPNVAVPSTVYPQGIPGVALPGFVGPQRAQVLPDDSFTTHIQVPSLHTVCLWAYWEQSAVSLYSYAPNGPVDPWGDLTVNPLLGSYGMIHGYTQALDREVAKVNATLGWNG